MNFNNPKANQRNHQGLRVQVSAGQSSPPVRFSMPQTSFDGSLPQVLDCLRTSFFKNTPGGRGFAAEDKRPNKYSLKGRLLHRQDERCLAACHTATPYPLRIPTEIQWDWRGLVSPHSIVIWFRVKLIRGIYIGEIHFK